MAMLGQAIWQIALFLAAPTAIICGVISVYKFHAVFEEISPRFPAQFRDYGPARSAMDTFIWGPSMPRHARRQYLEFQFFASIAFVSFAIIICNWHLVPGLIFAAIGIGGLGNGLYRRHKYKYLL